MRRQARARAERRCEYCHRPDYTTTYIGFQVDHIIAVKHRGLTILVNLAYACFECNNAKGSDVASYDELTNKLTPLYNPRTQTWNRHFELDGEHIIGKTRIGRVTVFLLQMNSPSQIAIRHNLLQAGLWD
jgi:hypothetical protein